MLSLQEGLEDVLYLRSLLLEILGMHIRLPIIAYTDNRGVIDAINLTSLASDKRLRLDVAAIKEAPEKMEISDVKWCPGSSQLANCMTKRGVGGKVLLSALQTGQLPS